MARPMRCELPGGWYHVTARGSKWKDFFRSDRGRDLEEILLAELEGRFGLEVQVANRKS